MICPYCDEQIPDGSLICPICCSKLGGEELKETEQIIESSQEYTSESECEPEQEPEYEPEFDSDTEYDDDESSNKKKIAIYIGVGVGIVAAIVAVILIFFSGNCKSSVDEDTDEDEKEKISLLDPSDIALENIALEKEKEIVEDESVNTSEIQSVVRINAFVGKYSVTFVLDPNLGYDNEYVGYYYYHSQGQDSRIWLKFYRYPEDDYGLDCSRLYEYVNDKRIGGFAMSVDPNGPTADYDSVADRYIVMYYNGSKSYEVTFKDDSEKMKFVSLFIDYGFEYFYN